MSRRFLVVPLTIALTGLATTVTAGALHPSRTPAAAPAALATVAGTAERAHWIRARPLRRQPPPSASQTEPPASPPPSGGWRRRP